MKTKLLIAAAAATVAGALLIRYFMNRKEVPNQSATPIPAKRVHHLTDVFAHAKNHVDQL
jgi:hypothetical protein